MVDFTPALKGTLETTPESAGVIATPAEAIAGIRNDRIMTPLRVAQYTSELTFSFAPFNQAVPLSMDPAGYVLTKGSTDDDDFVWAPSTSAGTVITVGVDTQNGFAGTSDGDPNNPVLTLTTTVSGFMVGNGTGISGILGTGTGNVVRADGANIGTPSSIDLTNATNVPREQQRVTAVASTATLTPNTDITDVAAVTAQAASLTVAAPTGTPVDGQRLTIRIRDNGISRVITWNAAYVEFATGQLPVTSVVGKTIYAIFWYNAANTAWELVGGNPVAGVWGP